MLTAADNLVLFVDKSISADIFVHSLLRLQRGNDVSNGSLIQSLSISDNYVIPNPILIHFLLPQSAQPLAKYTLPLNIDNPFTASLQSNFQEILRFTASPHLLLLIDAPINKL